MFQSSDTHSLCTGAAYDMKIRNSTREVLLHNWKKMRALYSYKYSSRFDGLLDGLEYTISVSTELDGKTITQVGTKGAILCWESV